MCYLVHWLLLHVSSPLLEFYSGCWWTARMFPHISHCSLWAWSDCVGKDACQQPFFEMLRVEIIIQWRFFRSAQDALNNRQNCSYQFGGHQLSELCAAIGLISSAWTLLARAPRCKVGQKDSDWIYMKYWKCKHQKFRKIQMRENRIFWNSKI